MSLLDIHLLESNSQYYDTPCITCIEYNFTNRTINGYNFILEINVTSSKPISY